MRFFRWVIKMYINDDSMKGVVAKTFKEDKDRLPNRRRPSTIRRYLINCCDASDNCLKAFDELAVEYERKVHRK